MQNKHIPKNITRTSNDSTQNLWCRNMLWQHIVESIGRPANTIFDEKKGCKLQCCNKSSIECRGAHSLSDLKILPYIEKYNNLNKSKFNWVELYLNILNILKKDLARVKKIEHKCLLKNINSMNFIEVIKLWRNMARYYNKIVKELPNRKDSNSHETVHESGFTFSDDVPLFKISDELEDYAWAFVRLTDYCKLNQKVEESLDNGNLITVWDLCLATGLNCKEGVHTKSEKLCIDNFLSGKCSCFSMKELEAQEIILLKKLIELSNKLVSMIEDKNWNLVKSKKNKQKITKIEVYQEILNLESQIKNLQSRFIHYTELGMKPFNEQYKEYMIENSREPQKILTSEIKQRDNLGVHVISGHVTKVINFSKKK